ncbi:hypothetical protein CMUS01_11578 [Colletotrichum musicola]|uniref:Uncharacterized protein n=1 Tax=Colletotrichum musicola TaxID=2175873 RepID=A0A8H6JW92_9PEZI|nr:hypothetical protein CMUS01_11578 [Colletotrichum musicola]
MDLKNDYGRKVEAQLKSARQELQGVRRKHVDELDKFRREIQTKAVLIQQLQQNLGYLGSSNDRPASSSNMEPLAHNKTSAGDLVTQKTALREAQERATDMGNKVNGLKQAMKDKSKELAALEKRCADREAYTDNLEKELEEVRGTLEDVIGRVSTHQSRKRRRTEDPGN